MSMNLTDTGKRKMYLGWFVKRALLVVFDALVVNLSYYLALLIRFYMDDHFISRVGKVLPVFEAYIPYNTVISIVIFLCFRMYSSRWKYAGINDINKVALASLTASAVHTVVTMIFFDTMPLTYYVLGAAAQVLILTFSRMSYRIWEVEKTKVMRKGATLNVMIVGVGETGRILRQQIESDPSNVARPVCIFEPRGNAIGTIDGLPVFNDLSKMKETIAKHKVQCVILADSILPPETRRRIKDICKEVNVEVQDFSGYLQNDSGTMTLKRLMEYTSGPAVVVVDGKESVFENGEKATMAMSQNYAVKRIYARQDKLVVELASHPIVLNDVNEAWVQEFEKETGEKISFF